VDKRDKEASAMPVMIHPIGRCFAAGVEGVERVVVVKRFSPVPPARTTWSLLTRD
jgi:hypothetical protein